MERGRGRTWQWGRLALMLTLVTALVPAGIAPAQEKEAAADTLPLDAVEALRDAAFSLAKKKHEPETRELLAVLATLGDDPKALEKLSDRCDRALGLKRRGDPDTDDEADRIAAAAAALGDVLGSLPEDRRSELAEVIVGLDGSVASAQRVLGRVEHEGRFFEEDQLALIERRSDIEQAFQEARRLEIETHEGESRAAPLIDVFGADQMFHYVGWRSLTLHSKTFTKERLRRVLEEAVRAYAITMYLRTGRLHTPPPARPVKFVVFSSKSDVRKALVAAEAKGGVTTKKAEQIRARDGDGWIDARGYDVCNAYVEVGLECVLMRDLWMWRTHADLDAWSDRDIPPCLLLGHLNWVAERFLGGRVPGWDWMEDPLRGRTSDEMDPERRRLLRLARTGVAGVRAYMRHLAAKGQDPAWARSFVRHAGELAGEDLLKSMLVVEYLQETGRFSEILRETVKKPATQETFEEALGCGIAEFEEQWRVWLLAGDGGTSLVERLRGAADDAAVSTVGADEALAVLNGVRELAIPRAPAVELDPWLAKGCVGHAVYLGLNPDQAAAWPDAHEEYVDRPGYSPEGVRAAAASVIAPGVRTAKQAVDGWMATFYHRLPLLDPGLRRIGWGLADNVAVLDSASMVEPTFGRRVVVWPPEGGEGLPRRFAPELPHPKPGEDQSSWGYPVTVQTYGKWDERLDLTVTLHRGDATGPEVECIVSTPAEPSNPVLAPRGTWCLIPKAHLVPDATYTICIEGLPESRSHRTTFTFATGE